MTIPLVVFQMGNCGSLSLFYGVRRVHPRVIHTHAIGPNVSSAETGSFPERVRKIWHEMQNGDAIRFITLVREPMTWNASTYFKGNFLSPTHNPPPPGGWTHTNSKEIFEAFIPWLEQYGERPIRWMDKHIAESLKIDVYGTPFENEKGYYKRDNIELLVLPTDLENAEKVRRIKDFAQVVDFPLPREHDPVRVVGASQYAALYERFLDETFLPDEFVDKIVESQYFRHFFADMEQQVRQRWQRTGSV